MTILSCHSLGVQFRGKDILKDILIDLAPGQMTGLIGPNGAGKTTLLKALAQILPYRGTVTLDKTDISALSARERAQKLAYLAQDRHVSWPISVRQAVALGRSPFRVFLKPENEQDHRKIDQALVDCDIRHLVDRKVTELSGGERARVMLARLLAVDAPVILADEPVAALDPYHQLHIMDVLRGQAQSGKVVLTVMHDLALASRYCSRLILLDHGVVVADGSPSDILTDALMKQVYHVERDPEATQSIFSEGRWRPIVSGDASRSPKG